MSEEKQAALDALAAKVKPVPSAVSVSAASKEDPFADIEVEFKRQQLIKQALHEERMRQLEIEEKELSIQEKKANLVDAKERQDERAVKRENVSMNSKTKGQALKSMMEADRQVQKRCNHRKGGNGLQGVVAGKGDAAQYAVMKHTFCHNDTWVRCLRCGKTWKPPLERSFKNKEDFYTAVAEYRVALEFQTLNSSSSSSQFGFSDGGAHMREIMEPVSLR
jgi:hypothetical protein